MHLGHSQWGRVAVRATVLPPDCYYVQLQSDGRGSDLQLRVHSRKLQAKYIKMSRFDTSHSIMLENKAAAEAAPRGAMSSPYGHPTILTKLLHPLWLPLLLALLLRVLRVLRVLLPPGI